MGHYKYSKGFILLVIQLYLSGNFSIGDLAQKFQIHKSALKEWYRK
ncbi:helix-turn-helix domain-containing protein [Ureibacillus massiliensis]|nr:helix-turn-helix domain-containing protein [Ureibacillus massiliensis]